MSIKLLDIVREIRYLLNRSLLARTAIRLAVRAVFFALSPLAAKAASVAGFGGTAEAVPFQSGSHAEAVPLTNDFKAVHDSASEASCLFRARRVSACSGGFLRERPGCCRWSGWPGGIR